MVFEYIYICLIVGLKKYKTFSNGKKAFNGLTYYTFFFTNIITCIKHSIHTPFFCGYYEDYFTVQRDIESFYNPYFFIY